MLSEASGKPDLKTASLAADIHDDVYRSGFIHDRDHRFMGMVCKDVNVSIYPFKIPKTWC